MNKKRIMCSIFMINFIFVIICTCYMYTTSTYQKIYDGKQMIKIQKPTSASNSTYIENIYEISKQLSSDIMLEHINSSYDYEYYRTECNEDFIKISTETGRPITDKSTVFSSHPSGNEKKIYGFVNSSDAIKILSLHSAETLDLTNQTYFVDSDKADEFLHLLTQYGFSCEKETGEIITDYFSEWYLALAILIFFLFISVVFYALSRKRESAIKKSMGYSVTKICKDEFKKCFPVFFFEILIITCFAIIIFSIIYDIHSTLLFVLYLIPYSFGFFLFTLFIFGISFWYIGLISNINDVKGKSHEKELLFVTLCFKTIFLILVMNSMSNISIIDTFNLYTNIKHIKSTSEKYATFVVKDFTDADNNYEEYYERLINCYRELHKNNELIIATEVSDIPQFDAKSIDVNDNFINFCDCLKTSNGTRITSQMLAKEKVNYLIPENFNSKDYIEQICKGKSLNENKINIIDYSSDSSFFIFNRINNDFYAENPIIKVIDPEYDYKYESIKTAYYTLSSYFSNSMFFKYDFTSDQSAFDQVSPLLSKNGLNNFILSSPALSDVFSESLHAAYTKMIKNIVMLLVYAFSFIVMLVYSSELYLSCYRQNISIKLIYGYSALSIISNQIISMAAIIPLLLYSPKLINNLYELKPINPLIIIFSVSVEIIIFTILFSVQCKKNVVKTLKGN